MRPLDVLRAVLVAVIWGLAFVATRIGLDEVSPPELTALRFALAASRRCSGRVLLCRGRS